MNIEQIDDNKIKVTVDQNDQKEFGVTYESMNYSDVNTRKLCEKIMSIARAQVGFKIGNAKLLVEARQTCNGSVTLYLSRIPVSKDDYEQLYCQMVCFKDANSLMDGCKFFKAYLQNLEDSILYYYNNKYYLYFEIVSTRQCVDALIRSVAEYGERSSLNRCVLDEHGQSITPSGAVDKVLAVL